MTYVPATTLESSQLPPSVVVYSRGLFTETIDQLIPSGLKDIWDYKQFCVHKLPDFGSAIPRLELFTFGREDGAPFQSIPVDEYGDFRDMKSLGLDDIAEDIKALAFLAAESYVSNVKNAFIKGGRSTKYSQTRLCFTDWKDEFKVNVCAHGDGLCPDSSPAGWCAYRYRFAATKI
jgi:hypothetical protein